ncbi:MAG TPA: O-antigen translocase [Devosiaceae bacterium]|nr:O-antigen translocase [Devosiaceae bacterium]
MVSESSHENERQSSYLQIVRSTSLIGLSSVITIIFSIIRVKVLAVLLGPAGVGLFGLYSLIADLTVSLAGIGAQSSGVRQVAEAVGSGDAARIGRTATVLNWVTIILGVAGGAMLAALAMPVSQLTFGNTLEAGGVALLGMAVFLRLATGAPAAIIQGTRHIGDLARMTVLGALLDTVVTIPLVYFFGTDGMVPSLVAMAFVSLLAALWYRRRIAIPAAPLAVAQIRAETAALLKLGFAFMASGLLMTGSAYAIRIFILHSEGVEAAGLYQSAWAIGGLYAGFILQAMGTDFYPRLTAAARDHAECNRLVNEQAEISILLAGPGLIATMTFAPLVIALFYTAEFHPAVTLLRWLCLGMLLRIVAWPIGFIILAKGAQRMFFWTEVAAATVQVGLAWILLRVVGLNGAGMAFVGLYIWHTALVFVLVRRLTGFRWSPANIRLSVIFISAGLLIFAAVSLLPFWPATFIGIAATAISGLYSLSELVKLLPPEWFPPAVRPWISRLTFHRAARPAE